MRKLLALSLALISGVLLLVVWLIGTGMRTPDNVILPNGAKLEWGECWFKTQWRQPIHCGWFSTAPAKAGGDSDYQLPVVLIQHSLWAKSTDPILYLAGGPGAASWLDAVGIDFWQYWLENNAINRDLVLFDQRGVGLSKPHFGCPEFLSIGKTLLLNPGTPEENATRYLTAAKQCYTRLSEAGQPLQALGTDFSAFDVHNLMQLMDYNAWNIYGVSYGTRLAMEVQRTYPHEIRTVLLDSVYPPNKQLFLSWPSLLHDSIARIITWCENDDFCQLNKFGEDERPKIREMIWLLLERLREYPIKVQIGERDDFEHRHMILNDEILLSVLFDAQYLPNSLSYIPEALYDLYMQGNSKKLEPLVEHYLDFQFDKDFSDAVFWSVECHDSIRDYEEQLKIEVARYPQLTRYLQENHVICDFWRTGHIHSDFHQPVRSDIPTLILTGEDDPITPATWATEALNGFIHGHLFRFQDTSHSVLDSKACGTELYLKFLDDPFNRPSANCR